jgi:hypothetical protein
MGTFGATAAIEAALKLELLGRHGEFASVAEASNYLEYEVIRLRETLINYKDNIAASASQS